MVTAVFFAGCKDPADSTGNPTGAPTGGANTNPLFSESDTTVAIIGSEIELSDGDGGTDITEVEITVTGGVPTATKGSVFMSGTIPEGADIEEGKAYYESLGYTFTINGNKYSISGQLNEKSLNNFMEEFSYMPSRSFKTLKTNADKTKYYALNEYEIKNEVNGQKVVTGHGTTKYYLMKK